MKFTHLITFKTKFRTLSNMAIFQLVYQNQFECLKNVLN